MLLVKEIQQPLQLILKSLGIQRRTEAGFLEKEPTGNSEVNKGHISSFTTIGIDFFTWL
jgi:hypothetical protein